MFLIRGGKTLAGTIRTSSAKNSAVALLFASLMVRGSVELCNVPRIRDVERILELLASIGVRSAWKDEHTLALDTSAPLSMETMDKKACGDIRSSLLLFGALAARESEYDVHISGGCKLGERSVRPHIFALEKFGVRIASLVRSYRVKNNLKAAGRAVMYESGDTPTENAIMAAVLAPGETIIAFASANYMVQDLCYFLRAAGAKIDGIGTTTLTISGVKRLSPSVSYSVMPDPIEAMTFLAIGIATKSRLTVENCPMDFLELELEKLSVMGQKFRIFNERASANGQFRIADIALRPGMLAALPDKLYGRPFPGLNIDHVPLFVPILTQAKGRSLVHDWVYENRAIYYLELQKLGAVVTLLDPHRLFVEGPTALAGADIPCPPAIRPAMAIFIAMLAASGESVLRGTHTIERAHERLVERLQAVGATIIQRDEPADDIHAV